MDNQHIVFVALAICTVASPAILLCILGLAGLFGKPPSERATARITETAVVAGLASAIGILIWMLVTGDRLVPLEVGNWVVIPEADFHFQVQFVFDRLSVPFAIVTFVLVGIVGAFAKR